MNQIELCKENECTGCGACKVGCKVNAIEMLENNKGYVLPKINLDICVGCKKCISVCPVLNPVKKRKVMHCYAAYYADEKQLDSASGGVSAALANSFLNDGKYVCGAIYKEGSFEDGDALVQHEVIKEKNDLILIQGSKYVQSTTENAYQEILNLLSIGKKVLFFGTPCQVAGLINIIKPEMKNNLYTVDVVCHGVCGKGVFRDYINILRKHKNVIKFDFRDKTLGWGLNCKIVSLKKNGKITEEILPCYLSSYYQLFLKSNMYRENCYSCSYANRDRVSDITIGDYWGIENEHPDICNSYDIRKGISCILVNTEKGSELLRGTEQLVLFDSDINKIAKHNHQLVKPSERGILYEKYMDLYKSKGYEAVDKYFIDNEINRYQQLKWKYYLFKQKIKKVIIKQRKGEKK